MRTRTRWQRIVVALLRLVFATVVTAAVNSADVASQPRSATAGVANIREFGAVGDGVADDTGAIRQALASALQSKGTVFFPPGTYLITDTLTVTDTVTLTGAGWGSVLMLKNNVRRLMILVQSTSPTGETVGFQASNFVLDGNRGGQLDGGLLQINSAQGFVIDHLWVRNGGQPGESRVRGVNGISVAVKSLVNLAPSRGVVMNSLIENVTKPGILWSTHATDGFISGNVVRGLRGNSQTPCIGVSEGRNVTIVGNSVSECEGAGISIANGGNNVAPLHAIIANNHAYGNGTGSVEGSGIQVVNAFPDRNVFVEITGNVLYDNRGAADGYGVLIQNVDHAVINGNIVRHNRRSGIVLYNVSGALVEGNYVFENNTMGTPEHSGIMLHQVNRVHLTGNFVFDDRPTPTQAYGLFFSGLKPSERISVTNNVLYPNKLGAWHGHSVPTNTVFIGNRTTDDTHLAVGPANPDGQLEFTANASPPGTADQSQPALYVDVKYKGRVYRLPLYAR
jgi:parallel beta-helix repeat protein